MNKRIEQDEGNKTGINEVFIKGPGLGNLSTFNFVVKY